MFIVPLSQEDTKKKSESKTNPWYKLDREIQSTGSRPYYIYILVTELRLVERHFETIRQRHINLYT